MARKSGPHKKTVPVKRHKRSLPDGDGRGPKVVPVKSYKKAPPR